MGTAVLHALSWLPDCLLLFLHSSSSLLDYVREKKRLPEDEAITIFQQLLHSLQFCHRKDVSGARVGGVGGVLAS